MATTEKWVVMPEWERVARKMARARDDEPMPWSLGQRLATANKLVNNGGGEMVSRQAIAAIMVDWAFREREGGWGTILD